MIPRNSAGGPTAMNRFTRSVGVFCLVFLATTSLGCAAKSCTCWSTDCFHSEDSAPLIPPPPPPAENPSPVPAVVGPDGAR
ncbi:MAG: hypothetical protein LC104_05415 [Bacteroidales bacterium]|nr:hypothetical protein [Bacteroidales bacterium]